MNYRNKFPFDRARRVSAAEVKAGRAAIERLTGRKRPRRKGRPPKAGSEKFVPISIRLHPLALRWLRREAARRAKPYQSLINEILLTTAGEKR